MTKESENLQTVRRYLEAIEKGVGFEVDWTATGKSRRSGIMIVSSRSRP
jgi:adenylosuccinate synthase